MEFHETLKELRHRRGLTQEELAALLFVSRTAVSKWESGRGYPGIDSLRAIARLFSVSLDDLLAGDVLLSLSEEEARAGAARLRRRVCAALDLSAALLFFLPVFRQATGEGAAAVPLFAFAPASAWLKAVCIAVVSLSVLCGVLTLLLPAVCGASGGRIAAALSLCVGAGGALFFTLCLQPYAAALLFVLLLVRSPLSLPALAPTP